MYMKLSVYDIINDPLPKLNELQIINAEIKSFETDNGIVEVFNKEIKMDKLSSEHIYSLSLTYGLIPRGIIQVGVGKCDSCEANLRDLAIGLLLTGAEQFMCFHNHPGGTRAISEADIELTRRYKELGKILDIQFLKHIMITQGYYTECEDTRTEIIFGKEVIV